MKIADQFKVVGLTFLSIIILVAFIVVVSFKTTAYVKAHHAEGGEHGEKTHESSSHGSSHDSGHAEAKHEDKAEHAEAKHEDKAGHAEAKHEDKAEHAEAKHEDKAGHAEAKHEDKAEHAEAKHEDKAEHAEAKHEDKAEHTEAKAEKVAAVSGDIEAGKKVFNANTCNVCHKVTSIGATGAIGPSLDHIATTAASRGDALAYLKQSIEDPNAVIAEGYGPIMTAGLNKNMSDEEYQNLLAFLMSLK